MDIQIKPCVLSNFEKNYYVIFRSIILAGCLISSGYCVAQEDHHFIFRHLTSQDGLSNDRVSFITQDSSSFIWIGTSDGLNRFDGRSFKIYRHDPLSKNSLPHNGIADIAVERNGLIWIGTRDGLCNLDPRTDSFTLFKNIPGDANTLVHNYEPKPFIDHSNDLWVATGFGLDYYDRGKKSFVHYNWASPQEIQKSLRVAEILRIMEDSQHRLWCLGYNSLALFDRSTKKFTLYSNGQESPMFFNLLQKNDSVIYVCSWVSGLMEFNCNTKVFTQVTLKNAAGVLLSIRQWNLQEKNWITVGTTQELLLIDPNNGMHFTIRHDVYDPSSINNNYVNHIFRDRQNILWIGTLKGINQLNPQLQLFYDPGIGSSFFPTDPGKFGEVNSFYDDSSSYWCGLVYTGGLYQYDRDWKLLRNIKAIPPDSKTKGSRSFFYIYREKENWWYCTDSGLVKYDEINKKYSVHVPEDPQGESAQYVTRKIVPYGENLFFLRTWNRGVFVFDKRSNRFIRHFLHDDNDASTIPHNNILDITKNNRNEIYIATANGLCKYNPELDNFTSYYPKPPDRGISNYLGKMIDDKYGNLWITSLQGLYYFNSNTRKFEQFTTADGLSTGQTSRVCIDNHGMVWITTHDGISRFDPSKKQFLNFSAREGLPVNYFDGTFLKDSKGRLVAGYEGGVVIIDPDRFPFNKEIPPVQFSTLKVQDKAFAWTINQEGKKELRLNYSQNVLSVSFSVLNFTGAYQNKYYYRLEGFDNDWRESENGNITYTNLSPSSYLLRIKGANNSGVMNEAGDTLSIIISPPFWQTWWFRILALSAMLWLVIWLVRRRIQVIRHEAELKQKIAESEMMALRAQMNPHFIFNCLNSIDNLIQTNQKEKATTYLSKFAKLIRAILENSKQNIIPCWKDLDSLKLYLELEQLRWDNIFTYSMNISSSIINGDYKVPPMIIQPFVENAIHHGLLNKEDSNKSLKLEVAVENNCIKYVVEDNGVGRAKAEEYRNLNRPGHQSLGLQITSDRIHLFNQKDNGSVKIIDLFDKNERPVGTRIEILLINQS